MGQSEGFTAVLSSGGSRKNGGATHRRRVAPLAAAPLAAAAVAGLAGLFGSVPSALADQAWTGTTADYNIPTNWTGNTVPTSGVNASVDNGGTVLIQAGDPTWTVNDLRSGNVSNGTGFYSQTGSTVVANGWVRMGVATGTTGGYTMTGGLITDNGQLNVAEAGTGYFNMSGGTVNVGNQLWVGNAVTGNGTVNLTGGTMTVGSWIALGRTNSTAVINLGPGASLSMTNSTTHVTFAGNNNTLNQTGGTFTSTVSDVWVGEGLNSAWNLSGGNANIAGLELGNNGTSVGVMNLTGGVLAANRVFKGAGTGTFNFNGGTLQAINGSNGATFMTGLTAATVNAASTVDTNGNNITIGQAITHSAAAPATDGGLTYTGGGAVTLGGLNTYTGPTTINAVSALNFSSAPTAVAGVAGPITGSAPINIVAGNGALGSNANTYTGTLNVSAGATLVFGTGGTTGALSSSGTLQFTPGANVGFDRSDAVTYGTGAPTDAAPSALFTGSGKIIQAGTGSLTVGPNNTLTGGASIISTGTLNYTPATIAGPIALGGGGMLMYPAGTTTDVTTANGLTLNASGGYVNTNGNNVTFATTVGGTNLGPFHKAGAGTLTLNAGLTPTQLFVNAGSLVLPGASSLITANSYASVGQLAGDNGTFALSGGAKFTNGTNDFNVADVGATTAGATDYGTVTIADATAAGTSLTTGALYVGKGTSATAQFANGVVNQTGGAVTTTSLRVGGFGTGTYNLSGGTLAVGNAQDGQIASANGSTGLLSMTGGAVTMTGNFQPGASGNGTLAQSAGTISHTGGFFSVGRFATGVGFYNISGGSFTDTANVTIIGEQGTGTLNVSGTAAFNATKNLAIGNPDGTSATGSVFQSGGTVTAPFVLIGNGASATTPVSGQYQQSGGTLVTGGFVQTQTTSNVLGTVGLNGGTIQASNNSAGFFGTVTAANVQAGGVTFNNSGFSVIINHVLAHDPTIGAPALDGGFTATGTGTIGLMAANTYTGPTNVVSGTLAGTGSVAGILNVTGSTALATLAPGNGSTGSIGTFTAGATTFGGSSDYLVDLSGTTSDLLAVNGNLTLTGGTDDITFNGTPDGTSTYTLATYTGTEAGTFVPTNLPSGYALTYGGGTVQLAPTAAVPEPASAALIAAGAGLLLARRRNRNRA